MMRPGWCSGLLAVTVACGAVKNAPDAAPDDAGGDMPADVPLNRQHVVYSANDSANLGQIFTMRLDGTDKRQITTEAQAAVFGAVSPDGTKVVFTTTIANNEDLFVINIDGTGRRRLTTSTALDFRPAFSADGQRIAFLSSRDGPFSVYVITLADGDAGAVTRISPSANQQEFPAMAPGQLDVPTRVGYTESFPVGANTQDDIMSATEDGLDVTNLTNNPASDTTSSYSRDGLRIAFASDRAVAGQFQIWIMNADGSNPTQATTAAGMNRFHPSFDLARQHLIYTGEVGGVRNMFIANIDGTGELALTTDADKFVEKLGCWVYAD
jgi:Tol biopolymer transport system component